MADQGQGKTAEEARLAALERKIELLERDLRNDELQIRAAQQAVSGLFAK